MNKLVSRNPIQRFQQGGKKIKRTYMTGKPVEDDQKNIFDYIGGFFSQVHLPESKAYMTGQSVNNSSNNVQKKKQQPPKDYSFMKGGTRTRTPEEQKKWETEVWRQKNLMKNDIRKPISTNSVQKNTFKSKNISPKFIKGYNDEGLQAEIGGAQNIKAWQQKLKDFYDPGTYSDDGLWGKNTQAAYEKYLLAQNIQPQTPIIPETPITPTQQYTPTNYFASNTQPNQFGQSTQQFLQQFARKYNLKPSLNFQYLKKGGLISKNPINRFKNGSSFGKAFKTARAQGLKEFTWNGKKYTTRTKEEEEKQFKKKKEMTPQLWVKLAQDADKETVKKLQQS